MLTIPSPDERALGTLAPATAPARAMFVGGHKLAGDILLAPLSGISDVPFRRLARRFGAALVFSEMVASGELLKGSEESLRRAMADGEGLHAVQLAGRDPRTMGEAARRVADLGADLIDINFGCPAKKVVGGLSGSALMREPDLALRIIEATVAGAGSVPVTVKMRLGWNRTSMNAAEIARGAERAGIRLITVHGRTRDQFYEGSADWEAIASVKNAISIPLVANGDLVELHDANPMRRRSGADGLMIGRGACGRPWFPGFLGGAASRDQLARTDLAELVGEHFEMMLEHYGSIPGLRQARKHLGWYFENAAFAIETPQAARAILRLEDPAAVRWAIRSLLRGVSALDIEGSRPTAQRKAA